MTANVAGLEVPVPGVESDGCHGHVKCPLTKGQEVTFDYSLQILKELPLVKTVVTAQLIGDSGVLVCLKINGEVQD